MRLCPGTALEIGLFAGEGAAEGERMCLGGLSVGLMECHCHCSEAGGFGSFLTAPTTVLSCQSYTQIIV